MVTALYPTLFNCYRCGVEHRAYLEVPVICCGQIYRYNQLVPARPKEIIDGHLSHPSASGPHIDFTDGEKVWGTYFEAPEPNEDGESGPEGDPEGPPSAED